MADPVSEVGRALGGWRRIGGRHSGMFTARSGITVEVAELRKLHREFDVIRQNTAALRKEMDQLARSANNAMGAVRGVQGGGAGRAQNGMPLAPPPPPPPVVSPGGAGGGGGGGAFAQMRGMFGAGGAGMGYLGALAGGQAIGNVVGGVDARIDRGMNYAADVDRLNVIMQQRQGISQLGAMDQRRPIANYRLGAGGVSQVLQFQTQYGHAPSARSIEGLRTLSGYTKSTADVLADQAALGDPRTANRMFNMLGVSAYQIGGGVTDPIKLRQQVTQMMGLTNASTLRGAKQQGSNVRMLMSDAGIPLEVQDEILGYAESNMAFSKQTGGRQGMYDPSNRNHTKIMGVENNFATQQEESERMRGVREDNFARRNLDNMAALERSNQDLIKALGSLEDTLSSVMGARTGSRNWMKIGGRIMQIGGAALALTGAGTAAGVGMMAVGTAMTGDPVDAAPGNRGSGATAASDSSADANIMVPVGYSGNRQSLNALKNRADFRSMKPQMQQRLLAMMRENPNVGFGGGTRDSKAQETMFKSRYRRTTKQTKIFWDGSYWEHVSGAAAAPPGKSMHEVGLAADLVGDLDWMNKNASRFGLKHFAGVNNEPWHVQPAELPNSRSEYEKSGATWGSDDSFSPDQSGTGSTPITTGAESTDSHGGGNVGGMMMRSFSGMSIAEIIEAMSGGNSGALGAAGQSTFGRSGTPGKIGDTPVTTGAAPAAGFLSGEEVARAAHGAGFRKDDLVKMVAIAKRESRWNPRAYNGNLKTGDQSYGLWQLNTLNSEKGGRMGDLFNEFLGKPKGNKNFDELFDPNTNARGAYFLYQRNNNTLRPWGGYKGKSNTYNADQYLGEAAQAVKNANLGDPMPSDSMLPPQLGGSSVRHSTSVTNAPTFQITVAPTINFNGMPSSPDLKAVAREVTSIIEQQVRTLEMRSA